MQWDNIQYPNTKQKLKKITEINEPKMKSNFIYPVGAYVSNSWHNVHSGIRIACKQTNKQTSMAFDLQIKSKLLNPLTKIFIFSPL